MKYELYSFDELIAKFVYKEDAEMCKIALEEKFPDGCFDLVEKE